MTSLLLPGLGGHVPAPPPARPTGSAVFSPCGRYRYHLTRRVSDAPGRVVFVSLNPSTASADVDDATIRKDIGFARRWGFGLLEKLNLFAWRSTDPRGLRAAEDPIGPDNDYWIRTRATGADRVVCAWGNHGVLRDRGVAVLRMLREIGVRPMCFRLTGARQPEHPLYMPYEQALVEVPC